MIEVLRRSPAGSGCALVATVPTMADARALVANDAAGILLRDERGELYPAEMPEAPTHPGRWKALRAGVWCLFFPMAAEMLDWEEDALRAYAEERIDQINEWKRNDTVEKRLQVQHSEPRTCPECRSEFRVIVRQHGGPVREYCSDRCATRARVRRHRASCNGVDRIHRSVRGQRTVPVFSCPTADAHEPN